MRAQLRRRRACHSPPASQTAVNVEESKPLTKSPQTGRPNVDWCEDHKQETIRSNVIGTMNLADCCFIKGVHFTNFATGALTDHINT